MFVDLVCLQHIFPTRIEHCLLPPIVNCLVTILLFLDRWIGPSVFLIVLFFLYAINGSSVNYLPMSLFR